MNQETIILLLLFYVFQVYVLMGILLISPKNYKTKRDLFCNLIPFYFLIPFLKHILNCYFKIPSNKDKS